MYQTWPAAVWVLLLWGGGEGGGESPLPNPTPLVGYVLLGEPGGQLTDVELVPVCS
jgi:hypothetical protein